MDALFMDFITVPWVRQLLFAVYALTLVAVVFVVISENRNPVKSLAWLLVLLLMPGGIIIYFIFGRDFKNTRMISRHNRRRLRRKESGRKVKIDKFGFSKESEQQIDLGRRLGGAMFYPNNRAEIYTSGRDKFDTLLRDIETAEQYINVQYYIFADDKIGRQVRKALINKARQGVTVRVMYDSVGSTWTSRRFFEELRKAGAQVHPFQRVILPLLATRINWRNHRKLCIIDGKIGYIGGMNVADRYIDPGKGRLWRDTHLRIEGPA
ncbi:MAG: PLDc N-terminal domain-containing protein, partial [Muribaculaceae bacterium]|nr:PLDc N-terminal domain-containing protein [Muribaculaceae bacterium]